MKITSVRIRKLEDAGTTKAVATAVINDEIAINRIRVIEGRKGLFVALQAVKGADGEYREIVHPVTSEGRKMLNKAVLDAYENVVMKEQGFDSLYQDGYEFKIVPGEEPVMEKRNDDRPFRDGDHPQNAPVAEAVERAEVQPAEPSKAEVPAAEPVRSSIKSQLADAEKVCASQPAKPGKESPVLG